MEKRGSIWLLGWAAVFCVPAVTYILDLGAPSALGYGPLCALVAPHVALAVFGVAFVRAFLMLFALPFPGVLYAWAVTGILAGAFWRGVLMDEGEDGSLRRKLMHAAAPRLRALCAAGVVLLVLACLLRSSSIPLCLSWAVNLFLLWRALPSCASRPSRNRRDMALTALLTVLSVCISLTLLELGARFILEPGRSGPEIGRMREPMVTEPHPTRVYTLGKNVSSSIAIQPTLDAPVLNVAYTTSSLGIRDRDFGPKPPNEFRILIVGDSYAFGYGVADEETISRRLEEDLAGKIRQKQVTVINGGSPGYGVWQERDWLQEVGFALDPDLVILQVFLTNDIDNQLEQNDEFLQAYSPEWRDLFLRYRYRHQWQVRTETWLRRHVHVYRHLTRLVPVGRSDLMVQLLNNVRFLKPCAWPRLPRDEDRPWLLEVNLRQWYPRLEEGRTLLEEDIRGMCQDCRRRGVDFIGLAVPVLASIYDEAWYGSLAGAPADSYERGKEVRIAEDIFMAAGIPYVPLLEPLRACPAEPRLYYPYDGHFTPDGTRAVAHITGNYLLRTYFPNKGLVAPSLP